MTRSGGKSRRTAAKPFGVGIAEIFRAGLAGWSRNVVPLTVAGAGTLAIFMAFRLPARQVAQGGNTVGSLALDLAGLVLASTAAHCWYCYALDAEVGRVDWLRPFASIVSFRAQAVASIWFWAGFLFGLRYLLGIPSIFVMLLYAFHGYVIADGAKRGLIALGTSVRLSQGRRIGLFGVMVLLGMFAVIGSLPLGVGRSGTSADASFHPAAIVAALAGLTITTSMVMVMGARLYRAFADEGTTS